MHLLKIACVLLFFVTALPCPARLHAERNFQGWPPPTKIFETTGRASEAEVVADPSGAVHAFWAYGAPDSEDAGWGQAIYYARLEDGKWSEPVDVLISPGGRVARMPSVAVDSDGYLQVIWSGNNAIFYSRAFSPAAGSAAGWTPPVALASEVTALEPAIAVGPANVLYAVWTQAGAGLMFARSDDGGQNWSTPQMIYQADRNNELARWGRIAVDEAGRIHAVLTYTVDDPAANDGRITNLLYYLRSDDRGATWTEPLSMTQEPDFGEINVATFGERTVHVAWNGRAGRAGRYHRWSSDGGTTWSQTDEVVSPENPFGAEGLTGFPAMVTDSTGALHLVSTGKAGDFYVRWANGVWSAPALISAGIEGTGVSGRTQSLEQPSLALSEGNRLHVVFHDGFERIWYTGSQIDAPDQPPQAIPTLDAASNVSGTQAASPTALATHSPATAPTLPGAVPAAPSANSPSYLPILVGVAPAVLLVGIVVLVYCLRRRH